jgi:hypothetical protein
MPAAISPYINEQHATKPTAKTRENMAAPVYALADYFRERARTLRGLRLGRDADLNELSGKIGSAEVAKSAYQREIERGAKASPNWEAEQFGELPALKAEREKLAAKQFPGIPTDAIERFTRREPASNWQRYTKKHFNGDKRAAAAIRAECRAKTLAKQAEVDRITTSPVTREDAKRRAGKQFAMLAEQGKPELYRLFAGYGFDNRGEYVANATPIVDWPQTLLQSEDSQTRVPAHNMLALVVWADLEFWKKRIAQLIDAEGDDENAVAESERPALLAAARLQLIEAQRAEEEAIKLCEAEGQFIGRPSEWPVPIMLQIERVPAKVESPKAPSKGVPAIAQGQILTGKAKKPLPLPSKDADAFEGDE